MDKKYDTKLLQKIYDNINYDSESEKAVVMARIFDVDKEVDFSGEGAYRKRGIVSVIESALEDKEKRMLAKIPDNLESIVAQNSTELGMGNIVYELIKDYAKNILKLPRYALFGALPAKIQEKLGKKYGENPLNYTSANIVAESIANAGLIAYLASTINFHKGPWLVGTFVVFCFYSGFNTLCRSFIRFDNNDANGNCLIRGLYESIGYTLFTFKKRYIAKKEVLTARLEQKKKLPKIETTEIKQLPSPELKAIVNTEFVEEILNRELKK